MRIDTHLFSTRARLIRSDNYIYMSFIVHLQTISYFHLYFPLPGQISQKSSPNFPFCLATFFLEKNKFLPQRLFNDIIAQTSNKKCLFCLQSVRYSILPYLYTKFFHITYIHLSIEFSKLLSGLLFTII